MTEVETTEVVDTNPGRTIEGQVVGVDGSLGAKHALDWALARTDILGPITPVLSYHVEALGDGLGTPSMYADVLRILRDDAESRLTETVARIPGLSERATLVRGHAGPALVRAAGDAGLLVVGSRGRSALAETMLGSVGSYCVKHAQVPVVVIPGVVEQKPTIDRIVVGIDGSPNSEVALRWAIDHLSPGGRIEAIGCWNSPNVDANPVAPAAAKAQVAAMLNATVARVVGSGDGAEVIDTRSEFGDARVVLREAAKTADLLVVGARGRRGVAYLLVGSVTTSLLHHPTSPTVVVPAP